MNKIIDIAGKILKIMGKGFCCSFLFMREEDRIIGHNYHILVQKATNNLVVVADDDVDLDERL